MNGKYVNFEEENTLTKYFKELKKSTLLTPDDEVDLAKKVQEGDENAKNQLINSNLKFVVSIAKEYQNKGLSLADLISEGNYGLVKAANKFDHTRGFRFISYAVWWIRQSILQSLNDNARLVRLPSNIINKIQSLKRNIEAFENENERKPIFGEIFDEDNQPIKIETYPTSISLNTLVNESDGLELIDLIKSDNDIDPEFVLTEKLKSELEKTLSVLTKRERLIIESYFGLNISTEPMTLEAIGEEYELTKERIRQIKEKAIRKLRFNSHELQIAIREVYL